MRARCHNCGERLKLPTPPVAGTEIICPACGVAVLLPPPPPPTSLHKPAPPPSRLALWWHRVRHGETRKSEHPLMSKAMRRVFDPLPRWSIYAAGVVLALAILAPFWVYLVQERFSSTRILLSEDTSNLVTTASRTNSPTLAPLLTETPPAPVLTLDQFHGLRLNENRDDVLRRFTLQLRNTRGMEPEIYSSGKSADWEQAQASFYGGLLKEFSVVGTEQRSGPAAVEKELLELFGEPQQRIDTESAHVSTRALGLPSLLGGANGEDLNSRLASFRYRRDLVWSDSQNRVDATIYYSSQDPVLCTSMVTIHISAASWLKSNQPEIGNGTAPATNSPPPPVSQPQRTNPPPRLFP